MAMEPTEFQLNEADLEQDPFTQFGHWYNEWLNVTQDKSQTPMTLATVDGKGRPSARIVLLKSLY